MILQIPPSGKINWFCCVLCDRQYPDRWWFSAICTDVPSQRTEQGSRVTVGAGLCKAEWLSSQTVCCFCALKPAGVQNCKYTLTFWFFLMCASPKPMISTVAETLSSLMFHGLLHIRIKLCIPCQWHCPSVPSPLLCKPLCVFFRAVSHILKNLLSSCSKCVSVL